MKMSENDEKIGKLKKWALSIIDLGDSKLNAGYDCAQYSVALILGVEREF